MNCKEATRLMSDSQERPLSAKERCALKVHKMMCSGCRQFDKQLHQIRHFTQQFAQRQEPPEDHQVDACQSSDQEPKN